MGNKVTVYYDYLFPMIQTEIHGSNGSNRTISNVTCDPSIKNADEVFRSILLDRQSAQILFNFIVNTILVGSICLLGFVGNALSFIVLRNDRSKSTTNFLLQGLAVTDTTLLLDCVLYITISPIYPYTGKLGAFFHLHPYILPYLLPCGIMAQTLTNWFVVLVTTERYIVVCWPFHAPRWCTIPIAKLSIFMVTVMAIAYNLPRFFEWNILVEKDICTNFTIAKPVQSPLRANLTYKIIYRVGSYVIFIAIGPMIILIVLNIKLILALRKATKERIQLTKGKQSQASNTTIIVVVVSVFIICQTPALVHQILEANDVKVNDSVTSYTTSLGNMLVVFNSSVNFFIYCLFGQKFRRILKRIVCRNRSIVAIMSLFNKHITPPSENSMFQTAEFSQITTQDHDHHVDCV
ncbi:FMRFamide receptor-like isoform X2 [Lineus longissimus]|uniref:FMRFamide receptor-like isoform X2 n=1 Tax=Lineus longissimus TaxID=88925 RepID=UPI00315C556B